MKKILLCALMLFCQISKSEYLTPQKNLHNFSYSTKCSDENSQATLSFVGDILIHKALYQDVVSGSKHFSQIWERTNNLIQKANFSAANLEGPAALGIDNNGHDHGDVGFIYDDYIYSGTNFLFNYHPRILSDLLNSGYDLVTSANNHALDRDSIGIDKTISAAKSAGLLTVGTRSSDDRNGQFFKIVNVNNIRIAYLGCTEMINDNNDSNEQVLMCYKNSSRILGIIKNLYARDDVDAIVVLPHWGVEYSNSPDSGQRDYARKYIEAGATAVIGSHPHVLQPWEKYVAKDGRESLIIYSLGNFVAGQAGLARKTGAVAYIGLSKKPAMKARIFGVGYTPTYRTGSVLNPISKNGPAEVLAHIAQMYGTSNRIEPGDGLLNSLCSQVKIK